MWLILWLKIHSVFIGLEAGERFIPKGPRVYKRRASKAIKRLQGGMFYMCVCLCECERLFVYMYVYMYVYVCVYYFIQS